MIRRFSLRTLTPCAPVTALAFNFFAGGGAVALPRASFSAAADGAGDDMLADLIKQQLQAEASPSATAAAAAAAASAAARGDLLAMLQERLRNNSNSSDAAAAAAAAAPSQPRGAFIDAASSSSSMIVAGRISHLANVTASRKEQGIVARELEAKHGAGASEEWLQSANNTPSQERQLRRALAQEARSEAETQLVVADVSVDERHKMLAAEIGNVRKGSSGGGGSSHKNVSATVLRLVASAMQGVLLHARSPTEARRALEFVAVASKVAPASTSSTSTTEGTTPPAWLPVWICAVQAAALSLATPELFAKLCAEATAALDAQVHAVEQLVQLLGTSADKGAKDDARSLRQLLRSDVQSMHDASVALHQTSLAWAASQRELESGLRSWASSLRTSQRIAACARRIIASGGEGGTDGGGVDASVTDIAFLPPLEQLCLLIRTTGVDGSGGDAGDVGRSGGGGDDHDPCRLDGGLRESALRWIQTQLNLAAAASPAAKAALGGKWSREVAALPWESFVALSSAVDSATGIKLMKMRLAASAAAAKKQESRGKSDERSAKREQQRRHASSLLELLSRFVRLHDVTAMEQVGNALLNLDEEEVEDDDNDGMNSAEQSLVAVKRDALLLMMRGYTYGLAGKSDFDSSLRLFTTHCRGGGGAKVSKKGGAGAAGPLPLLFTTPPTAEHYTLLLRAAPNPDVAAALFLDACAAGVVLDRDGYRNLFRRESQASLTKMGAVVSALVGAHQQQQAAADDDGNDDPGRPKLKIPPLPATLDAHALRQTNAAGQVSTF